MELRSGSRIAASPARRCPVCKPPLVQPEGAHPPIEQKPTFSGSPSGSSKRTLSSVEAPVESPLLKRSRLTAKNLRLHTKAERKAMAGKKTSSEKRPAPSETGTDPSNPSTDNTQSTKKSKKSTNTHTSDSLFPDKIQEKNIIGIWAAEHPTDAGDIRALLDREREAPEPDEQLFRRYRYTMKNASVEDEVHALAFRLLAIYSTTMDGYSTNINVGWTEVNHDLTEGFSPAKPDMCESYRIEAYPLAARQCLDWALQPSKHKLAMPSACVEFKGPEGTMGIARAQCAYDGAIMVESMKRVHLYLQQPIESFYRKTQALTVSYDGSLLEIYANHAVQGPCTEYHQAPLFVDSPGLSLDDFRKAYKHINNVLDWARARATSTLKELRTHDKSRQEAVTRVKADLLSREMQKAMEESIPRDASTIAKTEAGPISPPGSDSVMFTATATKSHQPWQRPKTPHCNLVRSAGDTVPKSQTELYLSNATTSGKKACTITPGRLDEAPEMSPSPASENSPNSGLEKSPSLASEKTSTVVSPKTLNEVFVNASLIPAAPTGGMGPPSTTSNIMASGTPGTSPVKSPVVRRVTPRPSRFFNETKSAPRAM